MSIPTKFQLPCSSSEISIPSMIQSLYMEPIPPELKLHIHFTKSLTLYKYTLLSVTIVFIYARRTHYCLL